jgi:nitroreductase
MNRRQFVASTTAALLAGGGAWCGFGDLCVSHDDSAYAAWKDWQAQGEPRPVKLVRAAILAASPHNTQPWHFRIGDWFVEFHLETGRSVRGLDPYLREAHIGMGCAVENLVLSAAANGLATAITLTEGALGAKSNAGALELVARLGFSPGLARESELHAAIPTRHTNRSLYDRNAKLPDGFAEELYSLCSAGEEVRLFLFTERERQNELARISTAANLELYSDPEVESGSENWIRWRTADVRKFQDGLTVENFGLSPAATAFAKAAPVWMLKRASSPEHRSAMYEGQMRSASLAGIIAVRDRLDQRQSLMAGRVWQRAHLLATAREVGARPCNEAIEMIDYERRLGRPARRQAELSSVLGDAAWQPTFLFLMGKPTLPAHLSPRRPIEKVTA